MCQKCTYWSILHVFKQLRLHYLNNIWLGLFFLSFFISHTSHILFCWVNEIEWIYSLSVWYKLTTWFLCEFFSFIILLSFNLAVDKDFIPLLYMLLRWENIHIFFKNTFYNVWNAMIGSFDGVIIWDNFNSMEHER